MKRVLVLFIAALSSASLAPAQIPGADVIGTLIAKHFDSNTDDLVDLGEWQGGMKSSFADMDADGNGSLSAADIDELQDSLKSEAGDIGAAVVLALIKQIVFSLDKDDDKLVSEKEFSEGGDAMFKKLDANNDGKLSKAELSDLPSRLLAK